MGNTGCNNRIPTTDIWYKGVDLKSIGVKDGDSLNTVLSKISINLSKKLNFLLKEGVGISINQDGSTYTISNNHRLFIDPVDGRLKLYEGDEGVEIASSNIYTSNGVISGLRIVELEDNNSGLNIYSMTDMLLSLTHSGNTTAHMEYLQDYSSQYNNRSLVDKEYVDNLTPSPSDIRVMFSANSPLNYNSTTGVFSVATGYQIPQTSDFTNWNNKQNAITGAASTITTNNLTVNRAVISDGAGKIAVSTVTNTELGYVSGVTSAIQTQLNNKQVTITGGATTITSSNLSANFALISDANGKVAVSTISTTKLGYLTDVTSNIQAQINGKFTTPTGNVNQIVLGNGTLGNKQSILRKVTETERLALTGLTDGDVVYQNNGGKGVYLYQNSTWYFVGEPVETKVIATNQFSLEDIGYEILYDRLIDENLEIPSGIFKKGHVLTITQTNMGRFTITSVPAITLLYPPTFSTKSYEIGATVRIKFLTDTLARIDGFTE